MKKLPFFIALATIVISACGAPAPAPTAVPPTAIPPTTVPPTETEFPPTATPQPTATLEPCSDPGQKTFESINNSSEEVSWFWVNPTTKNLDFYGTVGPGERFSVCTYPGHAWAVRNAKGDVVFQYGVTVDLIQRQDIP